MLISCAKDITPANTLRVDICAEIPTFDPVLADDWHTYRVINDLYAGLVDFDQANRPIPGMAYKWDISADGLTYTFHLRPDLKFRMVVGLKLVILFIHGDAWLIPKLAHRILFY